MPTNKDVAPNGEDKKEEKNNQEASSAPVKKKAGKNGLVAGSAVVILIIIALAIAYFSGSLEKFKGNGGDTTGQSAQEGGSIAATVDGTEITQSEVETRTGLIIAGFRLPADQITSEQTAQAKQIALQQLINETLILHAAQASGITVGSEQIQTELDAIKANFPDEQSFKQAMNDNKVTEDELRTDIARRLTIQKYIDANTDNDSIEVTEEEVNQLYDQYAANQENMPDIEEIRSQLEQQIFQQKLNQQIDEVIKKLQDAADITIL